MIDQRLPTVADRVVNTLRAYEEPRGCLGELRNAAGVLDRHGFVGRPSWNSIRSGVRPEGHIHAEPGEWSHGWQYYASSFSEHNFRKNVVLNQSCAVEQAHLRSHSGPGASDVLCGCPSKPEFRVEAGLFRTLILERARLLLQVVEARCECGTPMDSRGRHRAACSRSRRLRTRAFAPERTLAKVCREAGATVRCNAELRDMDLAISAHDERAIEVFATGLPLYFGAQPADITVRCAFASDGTAQPGAARVDGAVCSRAREDKERKYSELQRADRCRLVVVALETGGRWSEESPVRGKFGGGESPRCSTRSVPLSCIGMEHRWARMIEVSCGRSFASSLVAIAIVGFQLFGEEGRG